MKLTIKRYDPSKDNAPYDVTYEVPHDDEYMTLLQALVLALPQNQPNAPLYPAGGAPGSRPGALPHFGRPRYLGPPPRARSTAG